MRLVKENVGRILFVIITGLLTIVLARGRVGSDEGVVYKYVQLFFSSDLSLIHFLTNSDSGGNFDLQHRLIWFLLQTGTIGIIRTIASLAEVGVSSPIQDYCVTALSSWFAVAASALCFIYLVKYKHKSFSVSVLITSGIWLGSYLISFLPGAVIENLMAFLIVCRLIVLERFRAQSKFRSLFALALIDALLIAIKVYSLIFILATLPLLWRFGDRPSRSIAGYAAILVTLSGVWFLFVEATTGLPITVYVTQERDFSAIMLVKWSFDSLFSLAFGLVWTFPPIWWLAVPYNKDQWELSWKLLGIGLCMVGFASVPYWNGNWVGSRYLYPYLLILLPELAARFEVLIGRWRPAVLAVPLIAVMFVPVIDYRSTSSAQYIAGAAQSGIDSYAVMFDDNIYPLYDWTFNPVVFAWRALLAHQFHQSQFLISNTLGVKANTDAVYPMTGLSRIIYLLTYQPESAKLAVAVLQKIGGTSLLFWRVIRGVYLVVVLGTLVVAAGIATLGKDRSRANP